MAKQRQKKPLFAPPEGYTVTTTRRVLPVEEVSDPILRDIRDALADQERLVEMEAWFRVVFSITGIEKVSVNRIDPSGREIHIGSVFPSDVSDSMEAMFLDKYGGPGVFVLKAVHGGVWVGPSKRFIIGWTNDPSGGIAQSARGGGEALDSIDAEIARHVKRETGIAALKSFRAMNQKEGDDDVKPGELVQVMEMVSKARGEDKTADLLLEMLRAERERNVKQQDSSPWPMQILAAMGPALVTFLDKKLSPTFVTRLLAGFQANPVQAPVGFIESLGPILEKLVPLAQPFLAQLAERAAVSGAAPAKALPPGPPVDPSNGGPSMRRVWDDPDVKDTLTYVVQAIGERRFADAWTALRQEEETAAWMAQIEPGVDPNAYWFGLRTMDDRLREMKDGCLDFIRYIQEVLERLQKQMTEAAEAEKKAEAGGAAEVS